MSTSAKKKKNTARMELLNCLSEQAWILMGSSAQYNLSEVI